MGASLLVDAPLVIELQPEFGKPVFGLSTNDGWSTFGRGEVDQKIQSYTLGNLFDSAQTRASFDPSKHRAIDHVEQLQITRKRFIPP